MAVLGIVEVTYIMCCQGAFNLQYTQWLRPENSPPECSIVNPMQYHPCSRPEVNITIKPGRKAMPCRSDQHVVNCPIHLSEHSYLMEVGLTKPGLHLSQHNNPCQVKALYRDDAQLASLST